MRGIATFLTFFTLILPVSIFGQLELLSDEFDKTCSFYKWLNIEETENWENTHIESYDVNTNNIGKLSIEPWTTAWFASRRSNLLYKNLTGDFVFTSEVTATNKAGDDQPGGSYSLAGLMIRSPKVVTASGPIGTENYVFLSIGSASSNSVAQFEVKNTVDDISSLQITNIGSTTAQIRMVRIGGAVIVLFRLPGQNWQIRNRYNRSDMPDDVQVGFVTYADWGKVNSYTIAFHNENTLNSDLNPDPSTNPNQPFNPDIVGQFEFGRFTEPEVDPAYAGLNFWNENQVPNSAILAMFGFDSESSIEHQGWKLWRGVSPDWNDASNWQDGILPTSQDSILIPNCDCPEVSFPIIPLSDHTFASLVIEEGGLLTVQDGSSFTVDLIGGNSIFHNMGTITNEGTFRVSNSSGKTLLNEGVIECMNNSNCIIDE